MGYGISSCKCLFAKVGDLESILHPLAGPEYTGAPPPDSVTLQHSLTNEEGQAKLGSSVAEVIARREIILS
jgi:hypothetical protein